MNITLEVNGKRLNGWLTASVTRGIERAASSFRFTVSERWPGSDDPIIKIGDACRVLIDGEKVVTGFVSQVRINYDGNSKTFAIEGKSKTADIVRASIVEAKPYQDRKIEQIARDLLSQFNISVRTEVDTGKAITVKPRQGDTVFGTIADAVNMKGLLAFDDADGNLVLGRAGTLRADQPLVQRSDMTNVVTGNVVQTDEDRFGQYKVVGQNVGTDFNTAEDSASPSAVVYDRNIGRYLPLVVIAEKAADKSFCKERAAWERSRRAGNAISLQYDVNGWRQSSGALWLPNMTVSIVDEIAKISGRFVITEVTWSKGPGGELTSLSCVPPEAFSTAPELPESSEASDFWRRIEAAGRNATQ